MAEIVDLAERLPSRYGVPVIASVDVSIFVKQYFTACLDCTFCADLCCSYGVDVDLLHRQAFDKHAEAIEAYTGIPQTEWFESETVWDDELPGGGAVRTQVVDGACVFRNRQGNQRGCLVHMFCNDMGLDYHDIKSFVDVMFPLTVSDQTLAPADEVDDGTLVCSGRGPTLYRGLRDELRFYFGDECVRVLDNLEQRYVAMPDQ